MDIESFRGSSAGRVLRVGRGEASYSAFFPVPLPPEIPFDRAVVVALSEADRALGELGGLCRTAPNPRSLMGPLLRREAVLSSRIEGTQAEIGDLYAYQAGQLRIPGVTTLASEADVREVANYVEALEYGLTRVSSLPVSLRLIRELHERLLTGVRGGYATPGLFRTSQNWIGPPGSTLNGALFVPPPPEAMIDALAELEGYIHSDDPLPPLIRLALIHYQFEAIHPFVDGNGRVGRLLVTLLFVTWDLLPVPVINLSAYFERNRDGYYSHLLGVSRAGAWRDWLLFFLAGVAEQALDAATRMKQLQDLRSRWLEALRQGRGPTLAVSIVEHLFDDPVMTAAGIQKHFSVSHPTAMRSLRVLRDLGVLTERSGRGRSRLFVAGEILRLLE